MINLRRYKIHQITPVLTEEEKEIINDIKECFTDESITAHTIPLYYPIENAYHNHIYYKKMIK